MAGMLSERGYVEKFQKKKGLFFEIWYAMIDLGK
jgi:hypothetical protein